MKDYKKLFDETWPKFIDWAIENDFKHVSDARSLLSNDLIRMTCKSFVCGFLPAEAKKKGGK